MTTDKSVALTRFSAYVPKYRVSRAQIGALVGQSGRGKRAIANFDEDSTTMAVEAAAPIVADGTQPDSLWFATTSPAYVDKVNATAVHAALGLPSETAAYDLGANFRSGFASILAASRSGGLAVMADVREGKAGGPDDKDSADLAAAFSFAPDDGDPAATVLATASRSAEFLDRWRLPGSMTGTTWEERFGQGVYGGLGDAVVRDVLERAEVALSDVAAVVVTSPNARAARQYAAGLQKRVGGARSSSDLLDLLGNSGTAQFGVELVDQLERASAGDLVLAVSLADGADALLLRVGERSASASLPVRQQLEQVIEVDYAKYLLWRGRFAGESARRPDPTRPSSPFASRNVDFKFGLQGGRCRKCGTVQFPRPRVCLSCKAMDDFDDVSTAGRTATVATYTIDRLAFTASPPLVGAVLDLEGGGRLQCELTDVDANSIAVGNVVQMTFRLINTVEGIRNYFWKARPADAVATTEES
ncbi:OB-fold domain-containing protein [Modestobacter excelsi]|uniref:OB-fold domain-containing protein n=1 Tax=Modestobacter excelsi TaxID=2213161 RepID=UPI00110D08DF|nr:OB-fold domain-containing protein [Modestobacter excelsi]